MPLSPHMLRALTICNTYYHYNSSAAVDLYHTANEILSHFSNVNGSFPTLHTAFSGDEFIFSRVQSYSPPP